jgi:GPR1/FUN34/yaaH family
MHAFAAANKRIFAQAAESGEVEMSTEPPVEAPVTMPEAAPVFAPQPGIGVPVAVGTFGFSVLVLGLPTSRIISPDALGIFVPVAFGTGALGLFIGGLWEYRANNIFDGSFALFYACFLFTTALILRFFAPGITEAAGEGGFGDAFGAWLIRSGHLSRIGGRTTSRDAVCRRSRRGLVPPISTGGIPRTPWRAAVPSTPAGAP